jgi:hypothetical protein
LPETNKNHTSKRVRTWQEIAEEASRELDPQKLKQLCKELERALDDDEQKQGA